MSGTPINTNQAPRAGKGGGYARFKANNQKFGTPLPILLPTSPLHPDYIEPPPRQPGAPAATTSSVSRGLNYLIKSYLSSTGPIRPECIGTYDPLTRSVWVTNRADREILFERGFFGKGNLSRSDPSWAIRRAKALEGERDGRGLTSEEVTALRRKERKQFKKDRAQAMLDASLAAEAILTGKATASSSAIKEDTADIAGEAIHRTVSTTPSTHSVSTPTGSRTNLMTTVNSTFIPTVDEYAHALPEGETRLTPQTFLVRPTRPDQRVGKKKSPAAVVVTTGQVPMGDQAIAAPKPSAETERPQEKAARESLPPIEVQDFEHLQLNLEEAFFLSWAVGCLRVMHPKTGATIPPRDLLRIALELPYPLKDIGLLRSIPNDISMRPDNPFLVSYIAYHHYRSLGWVVKTGIKFCVDWLLYKRGLVFSHAEFALLVIPHYANNTQEQDRPFALPNDGAMTWQWLNTVNRVNTQVKKTLILCYVTIHSDERVTPKDLENPVDLLGRYSVREVTIRRFVPARMRD